MRVSAPIKALAFYGTLAVLIFGGLIAMIVHEQRRRETAPCSEFASWPAKDAPARCVPGWRE